jgi:hypothetical protein
MTKLVSRRSWLSSVNGRRLVLWRFLLRPRELALQEGTANLLEVLVRSKGSSSSLTLASASSSLPSSSLIYLFLVFSSSSSTSVEMYSWSVVRPDVCFAFFAGFRERGRITSVCALALSACLHPVLFALQLVFSSLQAYKLTIVIDFCQPRDELAP